MGYAERCLILLLLQAEKLREGASEPTMRFLVTDAAALCSGGDEQSDNASDSHSGVRPSEGIPASGKPSPSAATTADGFSSAASAEHRGSRSPEGGVSQGLNNSAGAGHDRQPGGGGSGREEGPRKLAPGSFDTVVDTFGLCSHADPVAALKASSCRTRMHH